MMDLSNAPRSVFAETELPDQLLEELTDPRTVDVSSSQQIGYLLLNRHLVGEEKPIVAIGGFMSDVTTPDRAWEGANLAALERPVLMLDMPGHGQSSPHSTEQIINLCFRRSADKQAEPVTEAVQRLLNPEDAIDYFGISHGSYLSLKATEQDPNDRVDTVFGIDVPAVKRQLTLGLQIGYVVADNVLGRKKYLEQLEGTEFDKDYEAFKDVHETYGVERANNFIRNNPGLFALNLISSVNARPGALASWKSVLDTKKTSVRVVTSGNGSVSDPYAIKEFIDELPDEQKVRSSQRVIPNEDHNIGIVQMMPRAVQWAEEAYRKQVA